MSTVKIGVFGAWRGNSYIELFRNEPDIEIVAICDKNIDELLEETNSFEGAVLCRDFGTFITEGKKAGMNAVFLANYFHQHAPYAIKAMNEGLDVISECTAASTLKECVELVECVERTKRRYMLAENYPFMNMNLKMEQIISSGELGSLLYAEGEYNHSCCNEDLFRLTPGKYHWRGWMPRTYYITHALGPVMYMTKSVPRYVSGRAAHSELLYTIRERRHNYDGAGMLFCEMDNGMIARVTGCTAMASDYSRYRVCGDRCGVEAGGYIGEDKVRRFYFEHTVPEGEETVSLIDAAPAGDDEKTKNAGHGGSDGRIVRIMKDYFLNGKEPFFDVYRSVAMSAAAILGWRSCLNHGENFRIPDFRVPEERDAVRNDDLTPFPDENGEGATLPCALPV